MKPIVWIILLSAGSSAAQTIIDAQVCENIVKMEPVNPKTQFDVGARAYCWIKVADGTPGTAIGIDWYANSVLQFAGHLDLVSANMRTYGYKTLTIGGVWRVDIKSPSGGVLKSLQFTVGSDAGKQVIGEKEKEDTKDHNIEKETDGYVHTIEQPSELLLPPGYDREKSYPLFVFFPYTEGTAAGLLHQYAFVGENADNFVEFHAKLFNNDPEASFLLLLPDGMGSTADHSWQGFAACIERYEKRVKQDIDAARKEHKIGNIYLAGFSLGGDLSWALSQRHPDLFQGAIVMGSRCSYYEAGKLDQLAKKKYRFSLVMGADERADRMKGIKAAMELLDKSHVTYQYKTVPGQEHVAATPELFRDAIRYLLKP